MLIARRTESLNKIIQSSKWKILSQYLKAIENITCTSLRPSVLITAPFFFTTIKAGIPDTLYLLFNDLKSQKNDIKWVERKSINRIYQRYYAAVGLPHCTASQSPCDSTMYDNISCSLLSDETNTTSTEAFWSFKS